MLEAIAAIGLRHCEFGDDAERCVPSFNRIDEAPHHIELVRSIGQDLAAPHEIEFDKARMSSRAGQGKDLLFPFGVLPTPGAADAGSLLFHSPRIGSEVFENRTVSDVR